MHRSLFFELFLLLTASVVLCIYEEQAGENDWHSEFVGQPIDTQLSAKDRFVVSTTSNVLASLSLDSGKIAWRQVLHESDQLQSFAVLSKPAEVISLSNSGTVLRAWRSEDGALLWEQHIEAPSHNTEVAALSAVPEATFGSGENVVLVAGGSIQVVRADQHLLAYAWRHCVPPGIDPHSAYRSTQASKAPSPGKRIADQHGGILAVLFTQVAKMQLTMQSALLVLLTGEQTNKMIHVTCHQLML